MNLSNLPNLSYLTISKTPSARVQKVLENEPSLQAGSSYLALGLIGMADAIVLVDSEGKVITLPFDEDSFEET